MHRLAPPCPSSPAVRPLALARAAALVSVGLLLAAASCDRGGAQRAAEAAPAPKVSVSLAEVKEAPMPRFVTLSGTLAPNEDSDVAAGASGKVLEVLVERGTRVKKGAVIARLDTRLAAAQAREAAAQATTLRAQRELAKADCARSQTLFDKGALTKVEYDRAQTACRTADSSAAAAEARALAAGTLLADAAIRAPFAGLVAERFVGPGEYVRPETKIATIVELDPLRLELTIPEALAAQVGRDMQVEFTTAAAPDAKARQATVRYVGPAVRRQTRDLVVEAIVENGDGGLRPGMFVTARLNLGEGKVPVVPSTAVRADGTLRHVFVAANGRVEDRLVQTGEERQGQIAVLNGVKVGEKVVDRPAPELRDGVAIQ